MSWNMQSAYDHIVKHLLTQQTRSMDTAGRVMYVNGRGQKDPVGSLISDEHYSHKLEYMNIGDLFKQKDESIQLALGDLNGIALGFLIDAQNLHAHYIPAIWKSRLSTLAHDWNLKQDILNNFPGDIVYAKSCPRRFFNCD